MGRMTFTTVLGALLASGIALGEESKPITLTAEQMDQVTAGDLVLPNDKVLFAGFDNASTVEPFGLPIHPSFGRSATASEMQVENDYSGPVATAPYNEGPWSAAASSPVISCVDSAGFGVGGICPTP